MLIYIHHGMESIYFNKNNIISKDETLIKEISDGDIIIVIENRYYVDDSYYNSKKNIKMNKILIFLLNVILLENPFVFQK